MVFRLAHEGLALQVIKLDGTLSIKFTPATKRSMNFTFEGTDTEETQQTKDARRKGSGELFQIPGLEIVLEEFLGKLELSLKSPKYGGMSMSFDGPLKQERKEIEIIDLEEDMDGEVKIEEQETLPANDSEQVGPSAVAEAEEVAEQMPSSSPARPKQRPSRRTSRSSDDDDDDSTSDGSHDDTSSPNHFDTLEGPVQIAEADHDYLSYWHVYLEGYHVGPTAYPDRPEFCAVDDTEPSGNLGRLHLDLADNVIYWEEPCADKDGRLQIKTPRLEWATMHECFFEIYGGSETYFHVSKDDFDGDSGLGTYTRKVGRAKKLLFSMDYNTYISKVYGKDDHIGGGRFLFETGGKGVEVFLHALQVCFDNNAVDLPWGT